MSQMPDSIYLHKDAKYITSGNYFAQDENTILADNDYDESVMSDYVEYTPTNRLEEAVVRTKKDFALTWEDIQWIDNTIVEMAQNTDWPLKGQEVFYTEVLRRFNQMKEDSHE